MKRLFGDAHLKTNGDGSYSVVMDNHDGSYDHVITGSFSDCVAKVAQDIREDINGNASTLRVYYDDSCFIVYDDSSYDYNEPLYHVGAM